MKSKGVFIRVNEDLLEEFTKVALSRGLSRSEAIRKAMEEFIVKSRKKSVTSQMRGLVRSRFSLKELEEVYLVSK
ncbi:MAG: ribbon-helix-helix protein, CopG family [Thermoprotei archaeon]|nr:ribbon-helix-helix protein, CopG family [Thermoprotei archaeon]